jgi:RHS repeat-associated protein
VNASTGNLSSVTQADGTQVSFGYDSSHDLTSVANGAGNTTTLAYNSSHQLTTVTPPTGNSLKAESLTYDGFGRVATVTDGDGNTVTYTYDLADRVTRAAYAGGADAVTVTYAYDGAGNLTTQADPSGTTTYAYGGRNLVTSRTATSGGGTLTYGYDADGNLTSATDAGGTTTYVYSDRNLMNQMTDPAGHLWEFAYNADGQRTKTWFNTDPAESAWSSKMVTSYDPGDRISGIQAYEDSSTSNVVSDVSYCYSKFVSGQSCPTATATTDTSLVQYATNNVTGTVSQFTYDKGNRLTKATSVNGSTTYTYGYDSDGNLTAGPANGTLSYNDAGQLTPAGNAGGNGTENFAYAGTGQDQVLADGTAAGITYGLAGQDGQPQVQSYTAHGAGTSAPTYVLHDQQGTPLGMMRNGNVYAFITDNLGSVTHLIDTSGATDAAYAYDPYGNQVSQSGGEALFNLIGYTGALTDPAPDQGAPSTGYAHLGNRWQNPATGTFTTQDTNSYLDSPADGNRYAYAADNPVNYVDPSGQGGIGSCISDLTTGIGLGIFGVASGFFGLATAETGVGLFFGVAGVYAGFAGFAAGLGLAGEDC